MSAESPDPPADPFDERRRPRLRARLQLLGGSFNFETDSQELLDIVRHAYARLPAHRLAPRTQQFHVKLMLAAGAPMRPARREPRRVRPVAGAGLLFGIVDGASIAAISPETRSAVVVVPRAMLRFPYHLRYELLEFAVYMLAGRVQKLVPLHAACVGREGRGLLLLGPSGAGKSTLALHCLLRGFDFLAEDSVLVQPRGLLATGVSNFLHVTPETLRALPDRRAAREIGGSPVIRRRSGVKKLEINLRQQRYRLARTPLRIAALVVLSATRAGDKELLRPLSRKAVSAQLARGQAYAAGQPGWSEFRDAVLRLPAFELRRGRHPQEGVEALGRLLRAGERA